MYPILIANDAASWFESGAVQDVTIRNNTFEECGYNSGSGAIQIVPENHELLKGYFVHKNIRIENNLFKVYAMPLLTARSTEGLVFANNTIVPTNFTGAVTSKPGVQLTACKKVIIKHNAMEGLGRPVIKLNQMPVSAVKTDAKIIEDIFLPG
jgi:hypothetical protein